MTTKKPHYLPQKYKTFSGAAKRTAYENSMAGWEFREGYKKRHYIYRTQSVDGVWRVERITPLPGTIK